MVKPNGLSKRSRASAKRPPPARASLPGPAPEGETEKRILAAARQEFIAKGLDGARMQAIAEAAGVNKALLHYYHRSKDRLYRTVVLDTLQNVWGHIRDQFQAHGPGDGLESMLRTLVSAYTRTLAANPEFPLFMIREMGSGGAIFQSVLREAGLPVGDVPMRLIGALQAEARAGLVKPIHPLHFFMNVMGMCVATFLARPVMEKLGPAMGMQVAYDEAFLRQRIDHIVDMAMNGIRIRRTP
jgi:AcrR family transcriptional regulator